MNPIDGRTSSRAAQRGLALAALALAVSSCVGQETAPALRFPPPGQVAGDAPAVTDPALLVVTMEMPAPIASLVTAVEELGYVLLTRDDLDGLDLVMLRFRIPLDRDGPAAIREVEAIEPSATAGVNHRYSLQVTGDVEPRQYANEMIGWPAEGCPPRRPLGLLDGPVDARDPALGGARLRMAAFHDAEPEGDARHGTAVAELLLQGMNGGGDVSLIAAAVAGSKGDAGVDAMARGLNWAVSEGAAVVNVSLAGPYNKILDRVFEAATARGVRVVAAVGNDGADAAPRYPAAFDDVIAVTAVDVAGAIMADAVRGPHVDFAAPGVEVWTNAQGGRYVTGTSFAAPYVTAVIATLPPGVEPVVRDLGAAGPDPTFGRGLVRAGGVCDR